MKQLTLKTCMFVINSDSDRAQAIQRSEWTYVCEWFEELNFLYPQDYKLPVPLVDPSSHFFLFDHILQ